MSIYRYNNLQMKLNLANMHKIFDILTKLKANKL